MTNRNDGSLLQASMALQVSSRHGRTRTFLELAAPLDDCRQFAGNAPSQDGGIRNGTQAFLGNVDDV